jgi:LysM repeat protein
MPWPGLACEVVLLLEPDGGCSYVRRMRRIRLLLVTVTVWGVPALRAQDAATEERLNKLSGQIEDLLANQRVLQQRIEALGGKVEKLEDQSGKPNASYASQEDLKRVAEAVEKVDRNRQEDYRKISADLLKFSKTLSGPAGTRKTTAAPSGEATASEPGKPPGPEKGFEYVIQQGDTLSTIVQAYREKNVKVSTEQILKANPGLKPEKIRVGQKIFIPAPQP